MQTHICRHTHTHTHIYIHTHTHTHARAHTRMHARAHTHMHAHAESQIHARAHARIYGNRYTHTVPRTHAVRARLIRALSTGAPSFERRAEMTWGSPSCARVRCSLPHPRHVHRHYWTTAQRCSSGVTACSRPQTLTTCGCSISAKRTRGGMSLNPVMTRPRPVHAVVR